jgi:hypothetical protein
MDVCLNVMSFGLNRCAATPEPARLLCMFDIATNFQRCLKLADQEKTMIETVPWNFDAQSAELIADVK